MPKQPDKRSEGAERELIDADKPASVHDIGDGLERANENGGNAIGDGFAKHNAGAARKVPPAQKSYSAELGEGLAPHAREQGRRFN